MQGTKEGTGSASAPTHDLTKYYRYVTRKSSLCCVAVRVGLPFVARGQRRSIFVVQPRETECTAFNRFVFPWRNSFLKKKKNERAPTRVFSSRSFPLPRKSTARNPLRDLQPRTLKLFVFDKKRGLKEIRNDVDRRTLTRKSIIKGQCQRGHVHGDIQVSTRINNPCRGAC